jgi:hypothetical protein
MWLQGPGEGTCHLSQPALYRNSQKALSLICHVHRQPFQWPVLTHHRPWGTLWNYEFIEYALFVLQMLWEFNFFIYLWFDDINNSGYIPSNERMVHEWKIGIDVEGNSSNHMLIRILASCCTCYIQYVFSVQGQVKKKTTDVGSVRLRGAQENIYKLDDAHWWANFTFTFDVWHKQFWRKSAWV